MTHILMVAAENGSLPGGKVGGIGDVVHDVPLALARRDCEVSVVIPSYGSFHKLPGASKQGTLTVQFNGNTQTLVLYLLSKPGDGPRIRHYVIDHPDFSSCGAGMIYCNDPPGRAFAADASKFSLFCSAVSEAIINGLFGKLDVLHLHDWHAAFLLILRGFMPRYRALQKLHCAYSIHNLALQGIRPFSGDPSSLETWFPNMQYDPEQLGDPRWPDCVNPMASAIRLADTVHAVSPSYAKEILQPSDISIGRYGGEGLENELVKAKREKRLFGILNGCEYTDFPAPNGGADDWAGLVRLMKQQVFRWAGRDSMLASAHFVAHHGLEQLSNVRPPMLITSIGRITDQKVDLMRQPTSNNRPALYECLEVLGDQGVFIMLGSGDESYERFLCETAAIYNNFIFLRGYSTEIGNALYQQGDLFFMPSSFEPCGISQMLAMREGQPCLAHKVGGLRDTIANNKTGFLFSGATMVERVDSMVSTFQRAMRLFFRKAPKNAPRPWQTMREAAAASRFEWADSIDDYLKKLYKH